MIIFYLSFCLFTFYLYFCSVKRNILLTIKTKYIMKISNSYSDCFYQIRNYLRQIIADNFVRANSFVEHGFMDFDLISCFADDLTAFNEVSGLPFFVPFRKFADVA